MSGQERLRNIQPDMFDDDPPSIWHLMGQRANEMVDQAIQQASDGLAMGAETVGNLRQHLTELLHGPLDHLSAWHKQGIGNISINEEVDGAVSVAVSQAFEDLNITNSSSNTTDFEQKLVKILDREIELDMMNKVFSNVSRMVPPQEDDFFHQLSFKDETMFVSLLCMGIIVPIIFITLFLIFLYKRRRENAERSEEMLLQNQAEFSMEEYPTERADASTGKEDVPDLVLKNYTV